ncbi:glycosyltransferase [Modestobacter sp. URMC 112]
MSYRRPDKLRLCLESLLRQHPDWTVKVLDNRSDQSNEIRALSSAFPAVHWTFVAENLGFARAVNMLGRGVTTDLLLLNPDAVVLESLMPLVDTLSAAPRVAAVGPWTSDFGLRPWDVAHRSINPLRAAVSASGYSARLRWLPISDLYPHSPAGAVGYVTGSCLLISSEAWADVGPFDERFFLYSEEVDWARRAAKRGWELRVHPAVLVSHQSGGTISDLATGSAVSREYLMESQAKYLAKHYPLWGSSFLSASMALMRRLQRSKRWERVAQ